MSHPIHNIHDKFMKQLLADKALAVSFLREYLPGDLAELIDFDTLAYQDTSYLNKELRSSFSDMVWRVQIYSEHRLRICLLLEHKSYADPKAAFQILEYLALGYQKQIREKRKPELIIPVLYYHGRKKWDYRKIDDYFQGLPLFLLRYLVKYESVFIDLQQMPVDRIRDLKNGLLRSAVLLQKHYFDPEELNRNISGILESLSPYLESNVVETIFVYLIRNGNLDHKQLKGSMNELSAALNSKIMSIYDQLIQEGIEKGLEKGIEKGRLEGVQKGKVEIIKSLLLSGKFTFSEIAGFTGMPEELVKEVANLESN